MSDQKYIRKPKYKYSDSKFQYGDSYFGVEPPSGHKWSDRTARPTWIVCTQCGQYLRFNSKIKEWVTYILPRASELDESSPGVETCEAYIELATMNKALK